MSHHPLSKAVKVAVKGVSVIYPGNGGNRALNNVDLEIFDNEFFTLLGPSGCGKTTLLRLIAGFEQPTEGDVSLDGKSLIGKMPFDRPVNTVFQSYALFPHMTVAQNIGFGLEMLKKSKIEISPVVSRMLQLVRLEGMEQRKPSQLSGGQQQRVALARALATQPRVLLLDESLSALDLQLRKEMQVELKRLQRETGITFIFVTHDQEEALTMSDRIAVIKDGQIQQIGTPQDIYDQPGNRFIASFIGEMNLWQATLHAGAADFAGVGRLHLPTQKVASLAEGSQLSLAVRPEKLSLAPIDSDKPGLQGALVDSLFLGNDTIYVVALDGQMQTRVRIQNEFTDHISWQRGDPVKVVVDVDSIIVLRD